MKAAAQKGNVIIILAITILALAGLFAFLQTKPRSLSVENTVPTMVPQKTVPPDNSINKTQTKSFSSKNLNLSIILNKDLVIEEKNSFVNLASGSSKINISRIATNFDNLNNYITDFDRKRKILTIDGESRLLIDNYNAILRKEIFGTGNIKEQKVYYIFINNWIYSLSTTSEALYEDLDKIAKSFKYSP